MKKTNAKMLIITVEKGKLVLKRVTTEEYQQLITGEKDWTEKK